MTVNRGTNRYFNNWKASGEQNLLQSLTVEAIKIYGQDMLYLPRTLVSYDPIYGEDDVSEYNSAIPIEMYVKSVDGFEGDGVFLSKFGLEIRDQVTLTVAKRTFELEVTNTENEITRPREGDLIYFPLNKKLFQIKYVNYKPFFYQLGDLQSYDLVCELFEYSSQKLNTGVPEIDIVEVNYSFDSFSYAVTDAEGNPITDLEGNYIVHSEYDLSVIEAAADNEPIADEQSGDDPISLTDDIIDWSEIDPFSEGGKY